MRLIFVQRRFSTTFTSGRAWNSEASLTFPLVTVCDQLLKKDTFVPRTEVFDV